MGRARRVNIAGITLHVVHRGHNRQSTFFSDDDRRIYLYLLRKASERYGVRVHAYVLMTNHVHLLLTQSQPNGISRTMQQVASAHTRRINHWRNRTGTLWECRFRSSPIDSEFYCLACYRYIELNPVRAGIVPSPGDYDWSSYRENTGGSKPRTVEPHESFLRLAKGLPECFERYRELVYENLSLTTIREIRRGTSKGMPVGTEEFIRELEAETGQALRPRERGRPKA